MLNGGGAWRGDFKIEVESHPFKKGKGGMLGTMTALVIMGNRDSSRRFPVNGKNRLLFRDGAGYAVSRYNQRRRAASERSRSMKNIRFVGLDVHAETIAVAVAEPNGEVRSLGTIPNREESIRKLVRKLGPVEQLRALLRGRTYQIRAVLAVDRARRKVRRR